MNLYPLWILIVVSVVVVLWSIIPKLHFKSNSFSLENIKDVLVIIQSVLAIIAIISAGIWFLVRGEVENRLDIKHNIHASQINKDWSWLRVSVFIKNIGKTRVYLNYGFIRINHVLPLDKPLSDRIKRGESLILEGDTEIIWPSYETYRVELNTFLDESETGKYEYDFMLPSFIKVVRLYTYFSKEYNSEFGWEESSIFHLNDHDN